MNPHDEYLSAGEAAHRLGVKRATLYAYASRGQVQSVPGGSGPARRYLRADVERLRARARARRGGPPAGQSQLRFGEPVLDSGVTWLSPEDGPLYRGRSAVALARSGAGFEAVAELLWTGALPAEPPSWPVVDLGVGEEVLAPALDPEAGPITLLALLVAASAARDRDRFDERPEAVLPRARGLLRRSASALALQLAPERAADALAAPCLAAALVDALGARPGGRSQAALEQALILLADHELNASTFAARVAASTQADIYACISAGLAALAGPRHGAASARVHALVREIGRPERAEQVVRERLGRGEHIPGFGHVVYRGIDPRATPLLETARQLAPRARAVRCVDALIDAMKRARRPAPNVDVALVSLSAALDLEPVATPALFAVARMAGWTAHVLEQYQTPTIIRPRARYLDHT